MERKLIKLGTRWTVTWKGDTKIDRSDRQPSIGLKDWSLNGAIECVLSGQLFEKIVSCEILRFTVKKSCYWRIACKLEPKKYNQDCNIPIWRPCCSKRSQHSRSLALKRHNRHPRMSNHAASDEVDWWNAVPWIWEHNTGAVAFLHYARIHATVVHVSHTFKSRHTRRAQNLAEPCTPCILPLDLSFELAYA